MDEFGERVKEWIKDHQRETLAIFCIGAVAVAYVVLCFMFLIPLCLVKDPACVEIMRSLHIGQ
jgi:hypothetical protein